MNEENPPSFDRPLLPVEWNGTRVWVAHDAAWVVVKRESFELLGGVLSADADDVTEAEPSLLDETGEAPDPTDDEFPRDRTLDMGPELGLVPSGRTVSPSTYPPAPAQAEDDDLAASKGGSRTSQLRWVGAGFIAVALLLFAVAGGVQLGSGLAGASGEPGLNLPEEAPPAPVETLTANHGEEQPVEAALSVAAPAGTDALSEAAAPTPETTPAPAASTPAAAPPAAAPAAAAPKVAPSPKAAPVVTEAPKAAPEPKPRKSRFQILVDQGWSSVESDPKAAATSFAAAINIQPDAADANYGLGYALLKQGSKAQAAEYLCRARLGDLGTRREITGLLQRHNLGCD